MGIVADELCAMAKVAMDEVAVWRHHGMGQEGHSGA